MPGLEHDDMQGLLARGYGHLPEARYLLLHIGEGPPARTWLRDLLPRVTPSAEKPSDWALHVAFTCAGLRTLGMHEDDLRTFSLPFHEGMAASRRRRVLGDLGQSHPTEWRWGGPGTRPVHVLLLVYARDAVTLDDASADLRAGYRGVEEIESLDTWAFDTPLEHFGFRDGIAQPFIEGLSRTGPPENTLPPGEFILGYENAYARMPATPTVPVVRDPDDLLPEMVTETEAETVTETEAQTERERRSFRDFGRNGSYLVLREMSQNVLGFWRFIDRAARQVYGFSDAGTRTELAARMVGRWPDGAPLILRSRGDGDEHAGRDDFGYACDPDGRLCPIGSHVRRANPRDAFGAPEISNRHRLLRRGRPFGAPVSRTFDVDSILEADDEHEECGLHFICLVADLARQFEFVQQTWINNAKFGGLYTDADPLVGNHDESLATFTLQGEPVRTRVTGMMRFVEVRGGAYFFLPGLRALRYLAAL